MSKKQYAWLEWRYRPLKDGLHDSGYRFISVVGVERKKGLIRTQLHEHADHILIEGFVNMDVEQDGTMRIMPWHGEVIINKYEDDHWFGSDAWFKVVSRKDT